MMKRLGVSSLSLLAMMATSASGAAASQGSAVPAICVALKHGKLPRGVWVDSDGVRSGAVMDMGEIDKTGENGATEYVSGERRFHVIVAPARLTVTESCSLSLCIETTKVPPRCPGTAEYRVDFRILPWKFGPGPFTTTAALIPEDAQSDYPLDLDLLAGRSVSGTVNMPWLRVESTRQEPARRTGPDDRHVSHYTLTNAGNRPVRLSAWEQGEGSPPGIELVDSTCATAPLAPGAACRIALRVAAPNAGPNRLATWYAASTDGRQRYTLYAEFDKDAPPRVTLDNR